jgi:hypothetical protein
MGWRWGWVQADATECSPGYATDRWYEVGHFTLADGGGPLRLSMSSCGHLQELDAKVNVRGELVSLEGTDPLGGLSMRMVVSHAGR